MTEVTQLALKVLKSLGMKRTWPLVGAAKSAIQIEAKFLGCTLEEAAGSIIEAARKMQRCGHSPDFAGWRERRMERMRRLTNKEQRKAILGDEFVEDCPSCACGNLHIVRKHNGDLFVGCDCFHSDCPCEYSYAVPEHLPISQSDLAQMTDIERAKAIIAAAPRCLNHLAPMSGRMGPYGLFAFCPIRDCEYTKSLEKTG
ncbi:MAG: hypothetical protein WBX38_11250 [Candidatus Sulfotelmatobacter sp.]